MLIRATRIPSRLQHCALLAAAVVSAFVAGGLSGTRVLAAEAAGGAAAPGRANAVATEDLPEPASTLASPREEGIRDTAGTRAARWVVVIDAGHGGADPGEVGGNGTREKSIVLEIALATADRLKDSCEVILTRRSDDVALTAEQRARDANYRRGDVFVSLHTGASTSTSANGFEAFIPAGTTTTRSGRTITAGSDRSNVESSRKLAQQLVASIYAATSATSRGVYSVPCRVFDGLTMPAALVEVGFVTNPVEEELLASEDYRQTIAEGLAEGIRAFLSSLR